MGAAQVGHDRDERHLPLFVSVGAHRTQRLQWKILRERVDRNNEIRGMLFESVDEHPAVLQAHDFVGEVPRERKPRDFVHYPPHDRIFGRVLVSRHAGVHRPIRMFGQNVDHFDFDSIRVQNVESRIQRLSGGPVSPSSVRNQKQDLDFFIFPVGISQPSGDDLSASVVDGAVVIIELFTVSIGIFRQVDSSLSFRFRFSAVAEEGTASDSSSFVESHFCVASHE
mmetsp:Transcript_19342/g.28601  ORF Transcript_19342/g.28601 Transcript_19342/m.28601 type:complete len:225 (-) Transcript_19342:132-806(-)